MQTSFPVPKLLIICSALSIAGASHFACDRSFALGADGTSEHVTEKFAPVLPASKFVGRAALGYQAAAQAPELCSKLFCYCGCDVINSHTSLLDCFTSDHGEDCQICQDEIIMAVHMQKEGKSTLQIQRSIEGSFGSQYPYDKPSPQLIEYRKALNLAKTADASQLQSTPRAEKAKLKAGAKPSSCCSR